MHFAIDKGRSIQYSKCDWHLSIQADYPALHRPAAVYVPVVSQRGPHPHSVCKLGTGCAPCLALLFAKVTAAAMCDQADSPLVNHCALTHLEPVC